MEYQELRTIETAVNTRGSKLWIRMNDNSKAAKNRQAFLNQHGGFFKQDGRYYKWVCPQDEKNGYWLKNVNTGEKVFFENMSDWGKQHGLLPVKICELLNGKRKTYKGWAALEVRDVKDGVGSFVSEKKPEPVKIAIKKQVTFQHRETKQIFYVEDIPKFSKENGYVAKELYKVARGALKSYKNLVVYNPFSENADINTDK